MQLRITIIARDSPCEGLSVKFPPASPDETGFLIGVTGGPAPPRGLGICLGGGGTDCDGAYMERRFIMQHRVSDWDRGIYLSTVFVRATEHVDIDIHAPRL